ncbi:MAG: SPFH domain-containing protein [Acidobacteriota bacterium]|nr:SPFH domain-containing protein [Acidobacteriota bacterium]
MTETVGLGLGFGAMAIMLMIVFIKANLIICQPNEILIISGRQHQLPDGTAIGYRVIKGGRGFKIPVLESVKYLSLTTMPIEIRITKALAKGIIPIDVDGRANVKIAGSEKDGLSNAIERFLGKNVNEIAQVAKETIEGNLRGVLAKVTPEEANSQRLILAEKVAEPARQDLQKLGLVLDFVKIQNISDDQGYLNAIGRRKNAEVIKYARIAEATAEAEARKVAAEQKRKGSIAEAEAEMAITQAENKLKVHRAELAAEANRAEQRAQVAGDITRVEEQQRMEEGRIDLNRKRYQADVVVPAEAEQKAAELQALGEAAKILEDGKATAEAIRLMKDQWQDGHTRDLFLIQMLPELVDKITRVVADNLHIDKLTVLDSGNGNGLPTHVKNLTGSAVSILEGLKTATGIDLPAILNAKESQQKTNGAEIPKELI